MLSCQCFVYDGARGRSNEDRLEALVTTGKRKKRESGMPSTSGESIHMPEVRRMLGDVGGQAATTLMKLIETQSKVTIANWCIGFAEKNVLPIWLRHVPEDTRPRDALALARKLVAGEVRLADVKKDLLASSHACAKEHAEDPVALAAARAIGCASGCYQTPTHSMGFLWYAAAAIAYDRVGVRESAETYNQIAEEICQQYTQALRAVAVAGEAKPVKVKWGC